MRCRQARHRFTTSVGVSVALGRGESLRLAYADPPYPGLSKRYYGNHPDYAGEVDHVALIEQLQTYEGWALSTSARALPDVLALCPQGVRVGAWVKGDRGGKHRGPLNSWEPVIFAGGRLDVEHDASRLAAARHDASGGTGATRRVDSLVLHANPRTTDPARVVGAKPAGFCRWMFDLLGAEPQDQFDDLFAGSGGVMRAWDVFAGSSSR